MFKFLGRGLSLSILTGAIVLTFAIILFLMAVVLAGEGPVIHGVSCQLGLAEDCIRQELREERQKLRSMQQKNREMQAFNKEVEARNSEIQARIDEMQAHFKKLQTRNNELEALHKRLSSLDHASSSYVVFYEEKSGPYVVSTGHTYASLVEPNTMIAAHCYFYSGVTGAGKRQINLGKMSRDKRVTKSRYSRSELSGTGLSVNDITALQERCRWPSGAT